MNQNSTVNITSKSLIDSVAHGKVKILKILLEDGADPNATVFDNIPILSIAIMSADGGKGALENILKLLIEYNADVNKADTNYRTPLMFACMYPHCCEAIVDFLLMNQADVSLKDRFNKTALDYAIKFEQFETAKKLISTCTKMGVRSVMVSIDSIESLLSVGFQNENINDAEDLEQRLPCTIEENDKMVQRKDEKRLEPINLSSIRIKIEDDVKHSDTKGPSSKYSLKQNKSDTPFFPEVHQQGASRGHRQLNLEPARQVRGRSILSSESSFECNRERNAKRNYQLAAQSRIISAKRKDGTHCLKNSSSDSSLSKGREENLNVRRNWCRRLSDEISRSRRSACLNTKLDTNN